MHQSCNLNFSTFFKIFFKKRIFKTTLLKYFILIYLKKKLEKFQKFLLEKNFKKKLSSLLIFFLNL